MRRARVLVVPGLVAAGVAALLVAGRVVTGGAQARPPAPPPRPQAPAQVTTAALPKDLVTLQVTFRPKGKNRLRAATVWDGKVTVSRGQVRRIMIWAQDPRDRVDGASWTLSTRRVVPMGSRARARGYDKMPHKPAMLFLELTDTVPETRLSFQTAQGDFGFTLAQVPFGTQQAFLKGLVQVTRAASGAVILSAPTEDDYASAVVGADGKLYVAYVALTHGKDFRARGPILTPPKDFRDLAQPTGGDQVLLLRLDGDRWAGPMPVTPRGQDVYRTAIAADGQGGIWVFWSAGKGEQWDLYARRLLAGQWSRPLRLTDDPGPDIFPAAATDQGGRVWVAWQAFRGSNSNILALRQEGSGFGQPLVVADGSANEWAPAIAASRDGQVAIAWDTYATGDYDVWFRMWKAGRCGPPIPVAASARAEMRASLAYDGAGRLWVAYEDGPQKWGKDQGALVKEGARLYAGRSVGVRVHHKGRLWEPADAAPNAFFPWAREQKRFRGANLALPRVAADAKGRVWLAVRSPKLGARVGVGTVWLEHVACYLGEAWSREVVCPTTDNILDNRPALVGLPSGEVVLVTSSDGRRHRLGSLPQWLVRQLRRRGEKIVQKRPASRWPDPVNNELVMARFGPAPGGEPAAVKLRAVPQPRPGKPAPHAQREAADVARARKARVTIGGKTLRLFRGEFHRHTELSGDGGGDGMLLDMWRYGLDVAAMDWIGNGDHDNGGGREYSWWFTQKTTGIFHIRGCFAPMFSYERSCRYPDGHRNPVFARRGIRTLPRLRGGMGKVMDNRPPEAKRPSTPDTQMLYAYLRAFDGVCASHTSGTNMGTDWRDNDPQVEPVVEIYQGCRQNYEMLGAPRSNTAKNSLGGWRPYGFVSLALKRGYRLGFQSSSDHISTHISYCNVWVEAPTREAILAALKARHVYGSTDNIIADVRCGEHFMGDEFTTAAKPSLKVHLIGTRPFAKVHVIKDSQYAYTIEPNRPEVEFTWTDAVAEPGRTSYYYVRGEQADGELVWVSPMWITYRP